MTDTRILKYEEDGVEVLEVQIKKVKLQIQKLEKALIRVENIIHEYEIKFERELGDKIGQLLRLQYEREKLLYDRYGDNEERLIQAEEAYFTYQESINWQYSGADFNFEEEPKDDSFFNPKKNETNHRLNDDEKKQLKKAFRKASMLCHPDKVSDDLQAAAAEVFGELKTANDCNDLKRVKEILQELENGNLLSPKPKETLKDKLTKELEVLTRQLKALRARVKVLRESDSYKTIKDNPDIDAYLIKCKRDIEEQIRSLS